MLDAVPPWAVQGGAVSVLLFVGLLIYLGRLVPLRSLLRELGRAEQSAADWKAAYERQAERSDMLADQVRDLTELARTTVGIVNAIPRTKDPAS